MEAFPKQLRPDPDETIECWDDDDDLQFNDDIQFRTASSAGSLTNSSFRPSGHRDSISSRRSARSDLDSNAGDEDWQVPLYDNDEFAKEDAIASARTAGIPIPPDIPKSALIGGTIKRLSTRKTKKTFVDDWSEDVELPGPEAILKLQARETVFPDSIRFLSSAATSPVKSTASPSWNPEVSARLQSVLGPFESFGEETDGLEFPDIPTLKAPTPRSPQKITPVNFDRETDDDFNQDFELPANHQPLELSLSRQKENFYVSSPTLEDFDLEWSEGSIGIRVGGTARDGRSVPSSSISIASPSVSSCLTVESGDDGLDGIVIPEGPLDFSASLQKRQLAQSENTETDDNQVMHVNPDADDFFSGIDVDNEKAFSFGKPELNPNIKRKTEQPCSPTRRPATTLTFTSTTGSPRTRIPRLTGHERTHSTHSTHLETVSESGAPLSKFRTSQSRLGHHSSQSSTSSLPISNANTTSPTPSISARRGLAPRASRDTAIPGEANSTARRLKPKRSLPSIRGVGSTSSVQTSQRPTVDRSARLSTSRPKTPVDRVINDGRSLGRRAQAPFMPAGASESQSHHASVKGYRSSRRTNSDSSGGLLSPQDTFTRLSRSSQNNEPFRAGPGETSTDSLGHYTKRTITRPTKKRNFGDGTELESFDDLSTSVLAESKYVKTPAGRGAPRSVRNRLSQGRVDPPLDQSPTHSMTSPSTSKLRSPTPRFAQDTNASRNAREQRIASLVMSSKARETNSLSTYNSNWKAQPVSRIPPASGTIRSRKGKPNAKSTSKPHLIKPMGSGVQDAKCKYNFQPIPSQ
jgi:hypothetical protein